MCIRDRNRSYDSMSHSRESSIHEDLGEGYVPMAPLSVDAGYMSMDQSVNKQGDLSPGLSSCSITSGTPSTDCRFSEFHLDKVSSYLTPSDDDIIFNVRQTRAYSTGSKPDATHNKFIRFVLFYSQMLNASVYFMYLIKRVFIM